MTPPHRAAELESEALPSARDAAMRFLWLLGLALQLWTLARVQGYQLADSVEYMDRADHFVHGGAFDPSTVRSFAFSALLTPLFALARWLRADDLGLAVCAARALQIALGLATALWVARIGTRLVSRAAGFAAALLLVASPIFLRYSIEPLSACAAMFCTTLGAWYLLEPAGWERGFAAGGWLGAAILMHFQCIPIVALLLLVALLRDRTRAWRFTLGSWIAILAALLAQGALDALVYGQFASSLSSYVIENAGYNLGGLLKRVGLSEWGARVYKAVAELQGNQLSATADASGQLRSRKSPWFYLAELPNQAMPWPAIALLVLGCLRAFWKPRVWTLGLLAVLLANGAMLSVKGEKSYRLVLPLLPFACVLAGAGADWLFQGARTARARTLFALALALCALGALPIVRATNLTKFGSYWRAVEGVNARARESGAPLVAGSVYHWAVQFRNARGVELVKLPHHLDQWGKLGPAERAECVAALAHYDWLIGHLQAFTQDPELVRAVNARFEVVDVFYERESAEEMEPVLLFGPRSGAPRARTLFEIFEGRDPGAYQAALREPVSVDYRRKYADGSQDQLVLLGWELEPQAPAQGLYWITYHWFAGALTGRSFTLADRFTDGRGGGFQNNHLPCHGAWKTSQWQPGWIVRESYLLALDRDPVSFGGPWRRGDQLPVQLWVACPEYDEHEQVVGGLNPFPPSAQRPLPRGKSALERKGRRWSEDGFMCVGGFWLPLDASWKLPDDGRVIATPSAASAPRESK